MRLKDQGSPIDNLGRRGGQTAEEQRSFLDALSVLNHRHKLRFEGESELSTRIQAFELAYRMQMSAPGILDVNQETEFTRNAYGLDNDKCAHFGKQCLLARRMIEQNVRFVQIYDGGGGGGGWDAHSKLKANHTRNCGRVDKPIAGLLRDLKQRGLLDETLVVWGGEFGRTSMNEKRNGSKFLGRDHHPDCFTVWMAGGGVKAGITYGQTDDYGYNIVENPVHVRDLHATILHCLGFDHRKLTFPFQGLDQRLTGVEKEAQLLNTILA